MRFAEIADSDESADEDANAPDFLGSQPAAFVGGIAERAKERARKTNTDVLVADNQNTTTNVALATEFSPVQGKTQTSVRKRKRIIADDDAFEDEVSSINHHNDSEKALKDSNRTKSSKMPKRKMKEDRRTALARYEAPEVDDSTIDSSNTYQEPIEVQHNEAQPANSASAVETTPGLPTPLSLDTESMLPPNSSHSQGRSKKRPLVSSVKDSQSSPMNLIDRAIPINQPRQAKHMHTTEEEDELAAVSISTDQDRSATADDAEFPPTRRKQGKSAPRKESNHLKEIDALNTTVVPKKRGRPKKQAKATSVVEIAIATEPVPLKCEEDLAIQQEPASDESKSRDYLKQEKELEIQPAASMESPTSKDTILSREKTEPELDMKAEAGKVVNYAAAGKSFSLKTNGGPRYRVGLSKKIRVDSLHQNIVRRYP